MLRRWRLGQKIDPSKEAVNPLNDTRQRPGDLNIPIFDEMGGAFYKSLFTVKERLGCVKSILIIHQVGKHQILQKMSLVQIPYSLQPNNAPSSASRNKPNHKLYTPRKSKIMQIVSNLIYNFRRFEIISVF